VSINYRHHSYNSKITVYKLSVIVLQIVYNFTDNLNLSPHSFSSTSLKLPITTCYRQLTHHHYTCPKWYRFNLFFYPAQGTPQRWKPDPPPARARAAPPGPANLPEVCRPSGRPPLMLCLHSLLLFLRPRRDPPPCLIVSIVSPGRSVCCVTRQLHIS
jgi:hypothetical protein